MIGLVVRVIDFTVQELQREVDARALCFPCHSSKAFSGYFSAGFVIEAISIAAKAD